MIIQVGFVFYITVFYVSLVVYHFDYLATATPRIFRSIAESVVWGMIVLIILSSPFLVFAIFWWCWGIY